jgi:NitT/TauT family transport system permease protein
MMIFTTNHNAKKTKPKLTKGIFGFIISAVFWLALWQIIALAVDREVLIASPFAVLRRLSVLAFEKLFWQSVARSLFNVAAGFAAGAVAAVILAAVSYVVPIVYTLMEPVIVIVKSTPVASFIILAIIWLDAPLIPMFTSFLLVMPLILGNVYAGLTNTDRDLIEMARVYKFGAAKLIRHVYIPSALPYFRSALLTAIGFAWKASIAAEVLCTPRNTMGKRLYESKIYLETADLFAWTIVVILLSLVLEKLIKVLINDEKVKRSGK